VEQQIVLDWFDQNRRELPWRNTTPWGVMVSEFMLQQTPVNRVLPIWEKWLSKWPTPYDLSLAKRSELITEWGRLGYPRRALRLHESSQIIARDFDNQVPRSLEALRSLPGVGEYTAAAIAAFAFNEPTLVMDVNIRRLFARVIDGVEFPTAAPSQLERRLRYELIPDDGAKWAAATMEFGALLCTSRNPNCDACPLASQCAWRAGGYPKSEMVRKGQAWAGTDRQCRGTIVQALRESKKLTKPALVKLWHDPSQVEKALKTLIADGLIETTGKSFKLPD
jgi:A/G-specific adenine glycosylase